MNTYPSIDRPSHQKKEAWPDDVPDLSEVDPHSYSEVEAYLFEKKLEVPKYSLKVPRELLLPEEPFLDQKWGCRRDHHEFHTDYNGYGLIPLINSGGLPFIPSTQLKEKESLWIRPNEQLKPNKAMDMMAREIEGFHAPDQPVTSEDRILACPKCGRLELVDRGPEVLFDGRTTVDWKNFKRRVKDVKASIDWFIDNNSFEEVPYMLLDIEEIFPLDMIGRYMVSIEEEELRHWKDNFGEDPFGESNYNPEEDVEEERIIEVFGEMKSLFESFGKHPKSFFNERFE